MSTQVETEVEGKVETEMDDMERSSNQLMTQRGALEDQQSEICGFEDLENDLEMSRKRQTTKQDKSVKNLFADGQQKRNKFLQWLVYGLIILACLGILFLVFGSMTPSVSSGAASSEQGSLGP